MQTPNRTPEQETPNRSILGQAFRAGSLGQALRDDKVSGFRGRLNGMTPFHVILSRFWPGSRFSAKNETLGNGQSLFSPEPSVVVKSVISSV